MGKSAHYKSTLVMLLMLAILMANPLLTARTEVNENVPLRVEFILQTSDVKSLIMKPGDAKVFTAIPSPPQYVLNWIQIKCEKGFPKDLSIEGADKLIVKDDGLVAALSYNGSIKLVNKGDKNIEIDVIIEQAFYRREIVYAKGNEVKVLVENPVEPFTLTDLTVKITIENFLPYKIVDIKSPSGDSLLAIQHKYPPEAIGVDPHHIELSFKYGLEGGEYTVVISKDERAKFPSSFLVLESEPLSDTVAPGQVKEYTVDEAEVEGAKLLGYIVAIYSTKLYSLEGSNVKVTGELVDYVLHETYSFQTKTPSYLVPPLRFRFWMKAYVVFGNVFTVVNSEDSSVNVLYMPVYIKEVGIWKASGIIVEIDDATINAFKYAFLVVQLPPYCRVKKVITPQGATLSDYVDSTLVWQARAERSVSVLRDQLYIQVKNDFIGEPGTYKIEVEWNVIKVTALDGVGRPLAEAKVIVTGGGVSWEAETNDNGYAEITPYVPGIFKICVIFKDTVVYEGTFIYFDETPLVLKCKVYDLTVRVKTVLGKPVSNATVTLTRSSVDKLIGYGFTDKDGVATLIQIPVGNYTVKVEYKRVSTVENVIITNSSKTIDITLDILFEIPFIGIPVRVEEATFVGISLVSLAVAMRVIRSRRRADELSEEVLDEIP